MSTGNYLSTGDPADTQRGEQGWGWVKSAVRMIM